MCSYLGMLDDVDVLNLYVGKQEDVTKRSENFKKIEINDSDRIKEELENISEPSLTDNPYLDKRYNRVNLVVKKNNDDEISLRTNYYSYF